MKLNFLSYLPLKKIFSGRPRLDSFSILENEPNRSFHALKNGLFSSSVQLRNEAKKKTRETIFGQNFCTNSITAQTCHQSFRWRNNRSKKCLAKSCTQFNSPRQRKGMKTLNLAGFQVWTQI